MAGKFDMMDALRYLILGAVALLAAALPTTVTQLNEFISGMPFLVTPFLGITLAGVILAGAGVMATDKLVYSK